jgi:hypothetical protein
LIRRPDSVTAYLPAAVAVAGSTPLSTIVTLEYERADPYALLLRDREAT